MPIKFACPSCQKQLKVKEELAGKKAACPGCKKVLLIPKTSTIPASAAPTGTTSELKQEELEDIASSLLAEKQDDPRDTAVIELTCPNCDAELKLPENLAGKQSPCPECRRIIRVPQLSPAQKKRWQDVAPAGPSLAKRNEEKLEDAWGTENVTRVSTEALYEAGAIKEVRPPVTPTQWAMRSVWLLIGLGLVYGGWVIIGNWREGSLQKQAAQKLTETQPHVAAVTQAEFHRLRAEYQLVLAKNAPEEEKEAPLARVQEQFGLAINALGNLPDELEKAASCRALLRSAQGNLNPGQTSQILQKVPAGPMRQSILRDYLQDQMAGHTAESATALLDALLSTVRMEPNLHEQAAGYGILGQEVLALSREHAALAADQGTVAAQNTFVEAHAVLQEALGQKLLAEPPKPDAREMVKIEALARSGKYAEAVQKLRENNTLTTLERTRMFLMLAEVAGPKNKAEMEKQITLALEMVPKDALWERERIVEMTLRTGETALAETRAGQLLGEAGKSRMQLHAFLQTLAQENGKLAPQGYDKLGSPVARAVAVHALARHNSKYDAKEVISWADSLPENLQPFAYLGVLHTLAERP